MRSLAIAVVPTSLLALILVLTGCGSTSKVQAQKPQYCYTNQTIVTENGEKVNSRTTVECSDDQVKRLTVARAPARSSSAPQLPCSSCSLASSTVARVSPTVMEQLAEGQPGKLLPGWEEERGRPEPRGGMEELVPYATLQRPCSAK